MGRVRIKFGPPQIYEFSSHDICIDIKNGDIYFKDVRGKLKKIVSQDSSPSDKKGPTFNVGTISGSNAVMNAVTASGNISASGNLMSHHVTASGDISASGTIYANTFESHGSTEIDIADSVNVTGGVIASGDISSSATLLGTDLDLRSAGVVKASIDASGNGVFNGIISSTLTSTGNISSSGVIHTDDLETGMGTMSVKGHMVPKTDYVYDLGSATHRWRDLHLNSSSIKFYDAEGLVGKVSFDRAGGLTVADDSDVETVLSASVIHTTGDIISKTSVIAKTGSFNVIEGGVF